jgi:hypothetical protein
MKKKVKVENYRDLLIWYEGVEDGITIANHHCKKQGFVVEIPTHLKKDVKAYLKLWGAEERAKKNKL